MELRPITAPLSLRRLDRDAEASYRDMLHRLQRIARHGPCGLRVARLVAHRYREALAQDEGHRREELWRDFFVALQSFVVLHAGFARRDLTVLESILSENADALTNARMLDTIRRHKSLIRSA